MYRWFRISHCKSSKMIILCHYWPLLLWAPVFWAARSFREICSSLKPNPHSQVELVQISDTHGTRLKSFRIVLNVLVMWSLWSDPLPLWSQFFWIQFLYKIFGRKCFKSKKSIEEEKFFKESVEINLTQVTMIN